MLSEIRAWSGVGQEQAAGLLVVGHCAVGTVLCHVVCVLLWA